MDYKINIHPSAIKDLDSLPDKEAQKILTRILNLEKDPRPVGTQKLNTTEGYRIRSGKYRILFEVNDKIKVINIFRVKHRKDVYRK